MQQTSYKNKIVAQSQGLVQISSTSNPTSFAKIQILRATYFFEEKPFVITEFDLDRKFYHYYDYLSRTYNAMIPRAN